MNLKFWISLIVIISALTTGASAQQDADSFIRQEAKRQTQSIRQGGGQWPIQTTEFFNIHYQANTTPDSIACFELDSFVERTLNNLDDSGKTADALRLDKISYYLCDDATVEKLTGYSTKGMADLAGRAVISSHFPHFHELAHLLVHFSLKKPALQTHPLLQEGIACLLGGRWGRAPETILYTSWVYRSMGMGNLADVMTREGFFTVGGGPDVSYPLGALFCEVIRREAGYRGLMQLYEELSGSVEYVGSLGAEDVVQHAAEICNWAEGDEQIKLDAAMDKALVDYWRCGIGPLDSQLPEEILSNISFSGGVIKFWKLGHGYGVYLKTDEFPVYLLSPATGRESENAFFTEHLPKETYLGQRYGLRCSSNDIALYDFATNQLLATWVSGFTNEVGACDAPDNGIVFEMSAKTAGPFEMLTASGCTLEH